MRPLALLLLLVPLAAECQTRRALVVGIDNYQTPAKPLQMATARLPLLGPRGPRTVSDLRGAVADADLIATLLEIRFDFQVVRLAGEAATADRILAEMDRVLVREARPGDIRVFYFAGHGSRIRNLSSAEADGADETLVPADANSGVADLRDKELARIFRAAVQKGVMLTAIFDSCHSGSIARGYFDGETARTAPPDLRAVNDPPDRDALGRLLPAPEQLGALILSAAQEDQNAGESETPDGPHGRFTWALAAVLRSAPPGESAERIFARVRARMQNGGSLQEPVMAGKDRAGRDLFGAPAARGAAVAAFVEFEGGELRLKGGSAMGLAPGCELTRIGTDPLQITVTSVQGPAQSAARVAAGSAATLRPGDLFQVSRWAAPPNSQLRVYVPPAPPPSEARRMARELDSLRAAGFLQIVDDFNARPSALLEWNGTAWRLGRAAGPPVSLKPGDTAQDLRAAFGKAGPHRLLANLAGASSLDLPPTVAVVSSAAGAQYILMGRWNNAQPEFSWLRAGGAASQLPARTNWVLPAALPELAARLARVNGWLTLDQPPDPEPFPYHLALRDPMTGAWLDDAPLPNGRRIKLYLRASPGELSKPLLRQRYVYVFTLDEFGARQLIFPPADQGNSDNRFPVLTPSGLRRDPDLPLGPAPFDLTVSPPFGMDTYFLLTSAEALPDPRVLSSEGVRTRGEDALSRMLESVEGATRGPLTTPSAWSLDRISLRSVPAR